MAEVKFCGMTRDEDVHEAARLGAAFVGVIMTQSPRRVAPERAQGLFASLAGTAVKRVAVFGDEPLDHVVEASRIAGADVVQLHGGSSIDPQAVKRLRSELGVEVWRVIRVGPDGLDDQQRAVFNEADGVLLDTLATGALGGTGKRFDWSAVAGDVPNRRRSGRLVVAGGLRPENVREAIDRLSPDVVDVSSGVESAPGVKDHARMAAFMTAVRQTTTAPAQ